MSETTKPTSHSASPKTKSKRARTPQPPKRVNYFTGNLGCQRCAGIWLTVDLNPERKVVQCPVCAQLNDIREAQGRGR
jgi:hypothetical protein